METAAASPPLNSNKRVFAYLFDMLVFAIPTTIADYFLPGYPLIIWAVAQFPALFRDAVLPGGSFGKRLAHLELRREKASSRLLTSFLRNLPIGIGGILAGLFRDQNRALEITFGMISLVVVLIEYVRIRMELPRLGDLLAGTSVVDLRPQEGSLPYFFYSLLCLVGLIGLGALMVFLRPLV